MTIALTIAGSDSGGGAGIQADLKTFHQFGVFGTSVVVAVTAQNTRGVTAIHTVPADIIDAQIDAVVDDLRPAALKTGMLATRKLVETVARAIARYGLSNYVLDPVMVATSGDRLLDRDAEAAIIDQLLPLASLVTPNLDEAKILTGIDIVDEKSMAAAAEQLVSRGAAAALVKGGHLGGPRMVDVLADGERTEAFGRERIGTTSTHGTGCTLSAAITAQLARGAALGKAVTTSLDFVTRAIATAPGLGAGAGPLNHFAPVSQ